MGFMSSVFGKKPSSIKPIELDPAKVLQKTVTANTNALPGIENLAQMINLFNQGQTDARNEAAMPGYSNNKTAIADNIFQMILGKPPQDVLDASLNTSAAQALSGGFAGSPMASKNIVRNDLNTRLAYMQEGLSSMERWMSMSATPNFDVTSAFISTPLAMQMAENDRQYKTQIQQYNSQVKAMPSPVASGLWNTFWDVSNAFIGGLGTGMGKEAVA